MRTINIITACAAVGSFLILGVILLGAAAPTSYPTPDLLARGYCDEHYPDVNDGSAWVGCYRTVLPMFAAGMADQDGR